MRYLKYFAAYSIPISAFLSLYFGGYATFICIFYAFGILPIIELIVPVSETNLNKAEEEVIKKDLFYDLLLYLNIPMLFGIIFYFLFLITHDNYKWWELTGMVTAIGICCGVCGINVAHELGHRVNNKDQFLAKTLLLGSLYMHFIIEHNRGHHKHVSTDDDPASAKLNEPVYYFWMRTVVFSFISAWNIEKKELQKQEKNIFSYQNEMLRFIFIQLIFLIIIAIFFSLQAMFLFIASACIGILLLETINYIEHYGLRRKKSASGNYERVMPWHSWNSNHYIGRICLYELTRHSDHHYLASRKYQTLRHLQEAPQLPAGYPAMMLLTLIPPVWFLIMNKRIDAISKAH